MVLGSGRVDRFDLARVNSSNYGHGYAVDSARGCFHDSKALPLLKRFNDDREREEDEGDGQRRRDPFAKPGSLLLDRKTGLNLVSFGSGYGDGHYNSANLFPAESQ